MIQEYKIQKSLFEQPFIDSKGEASRLEMLRQRVRKVKNNWAPSSKHLCWSSVKAQVMLNKLIYEYAKRHVSTYLCLRNPKKRLKDFPVFFSLGQLSMRGICADRFGLYLTNFMMATYSHLNLIVKGQQKKKVNVRMHDEVKRLRRFGCQTKASSKR